MCSEVTKLYENAGVKKEVIPCPAKYYGYDCTRNNWDDEDCSCDIEGYPQFTAEKQLELVKWLVINDKFHCLEVQYYKKEGDYKISTYSKASNYDKDFSECLASHFNNLWQDLTEDEKQQIKEILK